MKRLLCITANMNAGGAETFLMKMYNKIDKKKYQMDFLVSIKEKNDYEEEIKKLGGKIYYVPPKSESVLKSFFGIMKVVKKNKYKYVIRVNEHSLSTLDLIAAKFGGAKVLAMRSSNTNSGTKFKIFLHNLFKFLTTLIPNVKIAPSSEAGIYTFGKRQFKKGKVKIIKNGLNYEKFTYSEEKRKKIRNELGIDEKSLVIGHVGRFNEQKNHVFLIDIFYEVLKEKDDCYLLLAGDGVLKPKIEDKVKKLGIENKVKFLGIRNDIDRILTCFDILLFPSFYEGMPNVVIEAQASGLKCIISDTITKEASITELVNYVSLNKNVTEWAKEVLNSIDYVREDKKNEFKNNGYDIDDVVDLFVNYVFEKK